MFGINTYTSPLGDLGVVYMGTQFVLCKKLVYNPSFGDSDRRETTRLKDFKSIHHSKLLKPPVTCDNFCCRWILF